MRVDWRRSRLLGLMSCEQFFQLSKSLLKSLWLLFEFFDISLFWTRLLPRFLVATSYISTLFQIWEIPCVTQSCAAGALWTGRITFELAFTTDKTGSQSLCLVVSGRSGRSHIFGRWSVRRWWSRKSCGRSNVHGSLKLGEKVLCCGVGSHFNGTNEKGGQFRVSSAQLKGKKLVTHSSTVDSE